MEKTRKITTILVLAVSFCFALVSLTQSEPPQWANPDAKPVWKITGATWVDHVANPRFAIYDHMGNNNPGDEATFTDDLVLDKETGLVWARDSNYFQTNGINPDGMGDGVVSWQSAVDKCRDLNIGNRKGWRLPTVEELASLVDPSQPNPTLPSGHPFINFNEQDRGYWSYTTNEADPNKAWCVATWNGQVYNDGVKGAAIGNFVWPVRGGN